MCVEVKVSTLNTYVHGPMTLCGSHIIILLFLSLQIAIFIPSMKISANHLDRQSVARFIWLTKSTVYFCKEFFFLLDLAYLYNIKVIKPKRRLSPSQFD